MFLIVFLVPMVQLLLFGYAISQEVKHLPMGVYDLDRSRESRELVAALEHSQTFDLRYFIYHRREINHLLDSGDASMVMVIPPDFSENLESQLNTAKVQLIVDGSDSNTAIIALSQAGGTLREYAGGILERRLQYLGQDLSQQGVVEGRIRIWFNEDLKSANYMVPAVISLIMMLMGLELTSMGIAKERERGTFEQLMVTPLRPLEIVIGKIMPSAIIAFLDLILIIVVGALWFKVSIAGSIALLLLMSFLFLLSALGLGIFVSTVSATQLQAMMSSFFFFVINILLSGFMIPIENMPRVLQILSYAVPLRYFLVIMRGIFLKGSDITVLWRELVALLIFGVVIMAISALRFRRKLV